MGWAGVGVIGRRGRVRMIVWGFWAGNGHSICPRRISLMGILRGRVGRGRGRRGFERGEFEGEGVLVTTSSFVVIWAAVWKFSS